MLDTALHTASSQWWLVGWLGSLGMLLLGYLIAFVYYDSDADVSNDRIPTEGEQA